MKDVHVLGEQHTIMNRYLYELRQVGIQGDSMRFRRNLERIGEVMAYEISKTLEYVSQETQTPLGTAVVDVPKEFPVLATILRAGLPLHQGLLNVFDHSPNAFVAAYRKAHSDDSFEIKLHYMAAPSLQGQVLILADPMLATGSSMLLAYEELLNAGVPAHTHLVSVIASRKGVDYLCEKLPGDNCSLWIGAVDEELNSKSYIIPGLGDAGDLAFGQKLP